MEAENFFTRLKEKIAQKKETPCSQVVSLVRRRVSFDLINQSLIAGTGVHRAAKILVKGS